ncbi:MAG: hypothetical protein WCT05_10355 [Lentisphaeria bacterium]
MSTPVSLSVDDLDQIFKRDDIRGLWPEILNSELAFLLGEAVYELLEARGLPLTLVLGHDARKGSYALSLALLRSFGMRGGKTTFLGLVSSEQLYYACGKYPERYAAGVMITASHNPKEFNGMKFIHAGGSPFNSEDLACLKNSLRQKLNPPTVYPIGDEFAEYLLSQSEFSQKTSQRPLVKAVIDAGNGVGAVAFAPLAERLKTMGYRILFLNPEPDGDFPLGVPNPLMRTQIERLAKAVCRHRADLGIIFDGDADRAGFVDSQGQEIIPSQVYALVARRKLAQHSIAHPVLMRNLCCSQLLHTLFGQNPSELELVDTPVGHGQIKQLMRHPKYRDQVLFAGEHSGHYFYPEFFSVDSGFMTALLLLAEVRNLKSKKIGLPDILADWRKTYRWSGEINYILPNQAVVLATLRELEQQFGALPGVCRQGIALDQKLGLFRVFDLKNEYRPETLDFPDLKIIQQSPNAKSGWWFVVRPSGNENKLRLNFESWNIPKAEAAQTMKNISAILNRQQAQKNTQ